MLNQNKFLLPLSRYVQIIFTQQQGHADAAALQVQRQHLNKAVSIGPSKDTPVGWGPKHYHIQAILMYTCTALKGKVYVCKHSRLGEGIKIRG